MGVLIFYRPGPISHNCRCRPLAAAAIVALGACPRLPAPWGVCQQG